ncbi:hypothetical protein QUC31_016870 [Theobroma cacao]
MCYTSSTQFDSGTCVFTVPKLVAEYVFVSSVPISRYFLPASVQPLHPLPTNFKDTDIDKEISELKMSVNTRGRLVATEFLKQFI